MLLAVLCRNARPARLKSYRTVLLHVVAILFLTVTSSARAAETYPTRVIKMIVPTAAGGTTDVLARFVAEGLQKQLGQSVIIENRAGAGGMIGARAAAAAPADGYTLFFGNTATLSTLPAVNSKAGYDSVKSFRPVALAMESYQVLVVRSDFPAQTTAELLAYARRNPGKLNFGTGGAGNITHLSGELLKARTGIDFVPVHFRSGAESVGAMLGGDVQLTIDNITAVKAWLDEGKLRALAVTSPGRQPELPGVPTMAESGIPDFVVTSFFGVVVPAGAPDPVVQRLATAINTTLESATMQTSLMKLGGRVSNGTPDSFGALIASETRKWATLAMQAGIHVD